MSGKLAGVTLAAAAAALFSLGTFNAPVHAAEEGKVKCSGINACKGHSECATATSSCKGLNECAGKGWSYTETAEECTTKGGEVV